MESEPILVVGGTGGTGRHVAERLRAAGRPVRVAARRAERRPEGTDGHTLDLADPAADHAGAVAGVAHIVLTAGVPPGLRSEARLRATQLDGVRRLADAAEAAGFTGRFVYLTTLGLHHPTWLLRVLDIVKWNEVAIRRAAEDDLRTRSFATTVLRAGVLTNGPERSVALQVGDRPLGLATTVSRRDVARVIAALLDGPGIADLGVVAAAAPPLAEQLADLAR